MSTADRPARIDHYDIERELGRGAMGNVYIARDQRIGRRVALKTINIPDIFEDATTSKDFFRRLQREAEVCGSLQHRNIVTLYEAGYANDRISYLAMELVEGETLQSIVKRLHPKPLPLNQVLQIAADVLRGLAHAHEKSIVHRDIKPANILVTPDGTAKIADFGIARPQNSSMTKVGAVMGTPNYMSPEQVLSQNITPRADLFSLGAMLYEMLTATKPFLANDVTGILHNILRLEPRHVSDVNPRVPREVGDFVARLLSKSPAARPSAAAALEEVEKLRQPEADTVIMPVWRRPVPAWIFALTLALLVAAIAIALLTIRSRLDSSPTVSIGPDQMREFRLKRVALNDADALFEAKRYEESLAKYEEYLQKYPHSAAAAEGRDLARAAMEEANKPPPEPAPPPRPRGLLNRLRKVFKP